jgi:ATP-dependent Clp protease adapter protein ClpS
MPTETIEPAVIEAPTEGDTLTIPAEGEWEQVDRSGDLDQPYIVILYNCDCHTFEEVIGQMQKATGCSREKADQVANEVHNKGRAVAYSGSQEECDRVARILREIKLQVETDRSA